MVGRNGLCSGYKSQRTKGKGGRKKSRRQRGGRRKKEKPRTAENKNSHSRTEKKQGKHTGKKNQRKKVGITENPLEKHRTWGRIEKKLSFLCFFSKKQRRPRRETTSSGGRKQLAHQSSITFPFLCFQRGSNTGNTTRHKNRNCTEGSKFSAPVSSHRNRGVRASRS
jgi:hypothetical protein